MKIGVIGPGAVGSYYGAKLARAGHETHFLLRTDYEQVRRYGVQIISPEGNFNARPKAARCPEKIGQCDLVIVALKTTANNQLPKLLPSLCGPDTAILTLQNGLGNEEALAELVNPAQIMGGLCFVCLHRIAPGVVQHAAHGKIELAEYQRWPEPRTHDIATSLRAAGIPCTVRESLEKTHWEKLVWNVPFNGLATASCAGYKAVKTGLFTGQLSQCLSTDRLIQEPEWFELVMELMGEILLISAALGLAIDPDLPKEMVEKTRIMGAYQPSTLVDFLAGKEIELNALFLEPLRRARAINVATPRLESLCTILDHIQKLN